MDEMQVTPVAAPEIAVEPEKKDTVGFWAFLGMIVWFSIPVIGFISCFVMMFAPKNQSVKNFARAAMVWMVITALVTTLIIGGIVVVVDNILLPQINDALGMELADFTEVAIVAGMVMNKDYGGLIGQFKEPILESIGEEFEPLIDELATGDYNPLIEQVKNGEYTEALESLQNGEYEQLKDVMDKDVYEAFVDEIKSAANGEYSEALDQVTSLIPSFF